MYEKILDNIAETAKTNTKRNDVDYIGEDGLLVCGNCHTAKQVKVSFLGVEKTPYCLCKCEQEKRASDLNANRQAQITAEVELRRFKAFPNCQSECIKGNDMKTWTFANDDMSNPQLSTAAKKYVDNFEIFREQGKGLLLYGTVGTGKSYIAACITNALVEKGYDVLMTNFATIAATINGMSDKQQYYDNLNKYPLLVLDDLGIERDTAYMKEIVFNVIDSRCNANLPMIITSNLTNEELKNPADIGYQRLFSRIMGKLHPIKVEGVDRRKQQAASNYANTREILGI